MHSAPQVAADDGDLNVLADALRATPPDPQTGAALLRHRDPRVRELVIGWLRRHIRRCADAETRQQWAAALPRDLSALGPRAQRGLARLYRQLHAYVTDLPDWRGTLPEPIAIAWLVTAIQYDPTAIAEEGPSERLLHALSALNGTELPDMPAIQSQLLALSGDLPMVSTAALRMLKAAQQARLLTPDAVQMWWTRWMAIDPATVLDFDDVSIPPAALDAVLADVHNPARIKAIEHLVRQGQGARLAAIVAGEQPGPEVAALAAWGGFAPSAAELIDAAQVDRLARAAALRTALMRAHQRGVFVQSTDLVPLLPFFVTHRAWPAVEFADLCHVARDALVDRVAARPLDDSAWPRLLEVLAVSTGRGASAAIRTVLAGATTPSTIRAAIAAAGAREDVEAEANILGHLERFVPEALQALTRMGGAATARILQTALGLGDEPPAPWMLAWQTPALLLLWQLTPARSAARAQLLQRINPARMPPAITHDVAAERSEAARRLALNAALFLRPDKAIIRLADLGEDSAFDTLYGLLRECVVGLFNGAIPGDSPLDTAHTAGRPDLPAKVRDALLDYGRTLARRGRIRPVCLTRGGDPGAAIFVEICLDLAGYGGLEPTMQRCLLHAITPLAAPRVLERVEPLLRSRDGAVRAAAVRLFVARAHETHPHALARLLRDESEATVRPALAAMAEFAVRWATPLVAARLRDERPAIVRAAADALVRLNAADVINIIVEQLAVHDEPQVRRPLMDAYDAADLGPGPLVDALERAQDTPTRQRILRALSGQLNAAWIVRLLRAKRPVGAQLLAAVQAGNLALDGTLEHVHLEAVRQGVVAAQSPTTDPAILLHRCGWSDTRGRAALTDSRGSLDRILKRYGRACIELLPELNAATQVRLTQALSQLRGETTRRWLPALIDQLPRLQTPAAISGLLRVFMRIGAELPSAMTGRVIDAIRAVPPGEAGDGGVRLQALDRLGAILLRADVVAALADAQASETPVEAAQAVLARAFHGRTGARAPAEMLGDDAAFEALRAQTLDRTRLIDALIAAWPRANPERATAIFDWLLAMQPLGAPPWILKTRVSATPVAGSEPSVAVRQIAVDALDDPDPEVRNAAATRLLDWPDVLEAHREVLLVWLDGAVDVPVDRQWVMAEALDARPKALKGVRAIELLEWLPLDRRRAHADGLWQLWHTTKDDAVQAAAGTALRRLGAAFLLPRAAQAIEEGCWQAADLLTAGPLAHDPLLDDVVDTLRIGGQAVRAEALASRAVVGPLGTPAPPPLPKRLRRSAPAQQALVDAARGDDPQAARRALQALVDAKAPDTVALLVDLTRHPDPARRMLALRAVRQLADESTYLDAALPFLDDPRADVRRSVIEALSTARHPPALPRLIDLLRDPSRAIRVAARNGLIRYGADAVTGLQTALRRAHPDQRAIYARVLVALEDLLVAEADLASPPTTL